MSNAVNWFEIAVTDVDRAVQFYNAIFDKEMQAHETMTGYKAAFFPYEGGVGGSLVEGKGYRPSQEGALIYLNGGDDLNKILNKVEGAGGTVTMPKQSIGEHGFIAYFIDTEGNKVGLHSME